MTNKVICPECLGKKEIKYDGVNGSNAVWEVCNKCNGSGKVDKADIYYNNYISYMLSKGFKEKEL